MRLPHLLEFLHKGHWNEKKRFLFSNDLTDDKDGAEDFILFLWLIFLLTMSILWFSFLPHFFCQLICGHTPLATCHLSHMWAGLPEERFFSAKTEGLQIFAHERSKRSFQVDPLKYPICKGVTGRGLLEAMGRWGQRRVSGHECQVRRLKESSLSSVAFKLNHLRADSYETRWAAAILIWRKRRKKVTNKGPAKDLGRLLSDPVGLYDTQQFFFSPGIFLLGPQNFSYFFARFASTLRLKNWLPLAESFGSFVVTSRQSYGASPWNTEYTWIYSKIVLKGVTFHVLNVF